MEILYYNIECVENLGIVELRYGVVYKNRNPREVWYSIEKVEKIENSYVRTWKKTIINFDIKKLFLIISRLLRYGIFDNIKKEK